eukprot:11948369-Alexandrium_andersonii.AAC.1
MSASLVGSEMCIRDSIATSAKDGPERVQQVHESSRGWVSEPVLPRLLERCLLYTSDAADDM